MSEKIEMIFFISFKTYTENNMSVVCKKFQKFIKYIKIGNLQKVIELIESNQVDASARNNRAIIWAARNGHLEVVQYLSSLPNVDASARNNQAIIWAFKYKHLEVASMLLYFELKVTFSLSDTSYKCYHQLLLSKLRPITHKIAVSLTEFPTPLIIEIIEQSVDFAIYIPYHIKWNMVVAIKHPKNTKKY